MTTEDERSPKRARPKTNQPPIRNAYYRWSRYLPFPFFFDWPEQNGMCSETTFSAPHTSRSGPKKTMGDAEQELDRGEVKRALKEWEKDRAAVTEYTSEMNPGSKLA